MSCVRWMIVLVCALPLMGCAGKKTGAKKSGGAKATAKSPDGTGHESAAPEVTLPAIDKHSGLDIDEKRVRAFSPAGWRRASRSPAYLVRYESKPQLAYPAVLIIGGDPPAGFAEVNQGNQKAFVAAMEASLAEPGEGKSPLRRKPAAVTVGSHHGASWATAGEAKLDGLPKTVEKECVAVVVNGRMYTVEAWAPTGKLDDAAKASARAVAAALAVPFADAEVPLFTAVPSAPVEPADKPEPAASTDASAPANPPPQDKPKPKAAPKGKAPPKPKAAPEAKKPAKPA